MRLTDQDVELLAKALLKRAARIEGEAATQREQASRLIKHLAESRLQEPRREPA